jgi:hypothetical protein
LNTTGLEGRIGSRRRKDENGIDYGNIREKDKISKKKCRNRR